MLMPLRREPAQGWEVPTHPSPLSGWRVSRALQRRRRKATWSQPWFGALPLFLRCCTCVLVLHPPKVGGAFPQEGGGAVNLEEPGVPS